MNVKERVLTAMHWGEPDRVPLTVYEWMLPRGTTERLLREHGVGLIVRLPPNRIEHRDVEILTREPAEGETEPPLSLFPELSEEEKE